MHLAAPCTLRPLSILEDAEALFIDSAFELLLPEPTNACEAAALRASAFVDERLRRAEECLVEIHVDDGLCDYRLSADQVLGAYRSGIEAVANHCESSHGKAFHLLTTPQRHAVLGRLERGSASAGLARHGVLFALLLHHAAEAYFEAFNVCLRRRQQRLSSETA